MTTTDVHLTLRPPILVRAFAVGWPLAVVVFLVVEFRNVMGRTTVRREDVAEVTASRSGRGGSGWAVHLTLRTGDVVRLDVTQVPLRGPLRRRLDRDVAAVRAWVSGRPPAFL